MCHRPTSLHTLLQLKHTSPRQQAAVTNNSRSELGSPAFRPAVMPGSRNSASAISVCLLLCFCCVAQSASAGRSLQTLDKGEPSSGDCKRRALLRCCRNMSVQDAGSSERAALGSHNCCRASCCGYGGNKCSMVCRQTVVCHACGGPNASYLSCLLICHCYPRCED